MADAVTLKTYSFEAAPAAPAAAFAADGMAVSVSADLRAMEHEWRALQDEADGTVFQSFEWLAAWQQHIGVRAGVTPVIVAGRDPQGRMLFLLPLAIEHSRFARELVWLGMELCDYAGPLLAPDFATRVSRERFAAIWKQLLQTLAEHPRFGFDLVRLEKMTEAVGAQANPMLSLPATRHPSGAYVTPLAASWDAFYTAKRSGPTRRRDRTKRKNLASLGELRFVEPATKASGSRPSTR